MYITTKYKYQKMIPVVHGARACCAGVGRRGLFNPNKWYQTTMKKITLLISCTSCMKDSTENATPPKFISTKISDSLVQNQIRWNFSFDLVMRDTEDYEFFRFGGFWGVSISVLSGNCYMCR